MAKYTCKITDWPERDRPRERLMRMGAEALADTELLAILLRVGNRQATALDLARFIIQNYGGFKGLDSRSFTELCQVDGIGNAKAAQIKAAIEIGKRLAMAAEGNIAKVENSEDVYQLVRHHLQNLTREVFRLVLLTSRNTVIKDVVLYEGSLTESIVSPREVIKEALNHSAASVVFVHNHPSGNPRPSEEDKRVTRHLKNACEVVGINVLDHIIIGSDSYFSFADQGLL